MKKLNKIIAVANQKGGVGKTNASLIWLQQWLLVIEKH